MMQRSGSVGERSETSDFVGTFQDHGGQSRKAQCQLGNRHLIANGKIIEMSGLFGLAVAHAGEIAFDVCP